MHVIYIVYAPSEDENINTKDQFFIKLNGMIADIENARELFLLDGFNDKIGRKVNNKIVNPYAEKKIDNDTRLMTSAVITA